MVQFLKDTKVRKLSEKLGMDIDFISVRGGTNHCKYMFLKDGREVWLLRDGMLVYMERNENGTLKYSLKEHIKRMNGRE